jgi:hypothetical protein
MEAYGKPTIKQKIQRIFIKKVWYKAYAPIINDWNEEY